MDIKQEELGDMVEKEMASTSAAIEDAVRRIEVRQNVHSSLVSPLLLSPACSSVVSHLSFPISQQEMMSRARNESSGIKLEVNER